jgi:hypothetical protein
MKRDFYFVPHAVQTEIMALSEEAKADVIYWLAIRAMASTESKWINTYGENEIVQMVRKGIDAMIDARRKKIKYREALIRVRR